MNRRNAARFLGFTVENLNRRASKGTGPRYTRVGGSVHYSREDLETWAQHYKTTGGRAYGCHTKVHGCSNCPMCDGMTCNHPLTRGRGIEGGGPPEWCELRIGPVHIRLEVQDD